MRLIDADELMKHEHEIYVKEVDYRHRCIDILDVVEAPTIEAEQTILELSNLLAEKDKTIKELSQIRTDIEAEPITTEKAVEYLMRTKWFQEHDTAMIEKGMERQKKLNAIEAEPRKPGRWIIHDSGWEECSECHWVNTTHIVYHYCPSCGADMRGRENG